MSLQKRSIFSTLLRRCKAALRVNRFERTLRNADAPKEIYIPWNRGMGDVPLGLYGVNLRIRQFFPNTRIIYLTRQDLLDVFAMLPGSEARALPGLKRGEPFDFSLYMQKGLFLPVDPTKDLPWLPGLVVPKLLYKKQPLPCHLEGRKYIGMHVDTETGGFYRYEKNWPEQKWRELIKKTREGGNVPVLFGKRKEGAFEGVIDLRGETTLQEVATILFTHCTALVAPDSGILSTMYYVDVASPLHVISLWNDPNQGILRQNVRSPNPYLQHFPLIGLESISPDDVYSHIQNNEGIHVCE